MQKFETRPYWSPYLAGIGLGFTLIASYFLLGGGLGASGAVSCITGALFHTVAPAYTEAHSYFKSYFADGASPFKDWMIFQAIGVFLGGMVGAVTSGRLKVGIEKSKNFAVKHRLLFAFLGGTATGFAARLARGCTSGQALSGGSLMSLGSWAFMLSVFAGGYLLAWFVRRQWN